MTDCASTIAAEAIGSRPSASQLVAQRVVHPVQAAVRAPPLEVPEHRLPRRELPRQQPPGAAGAHHVQNRVDDLAARVLLPATGGGRRRQQGFNKPPLLVRQVAVVPARRRGGRRHIPQDPSDCSSSRGGAPRRSQTRSQTDLTYADLGRRARTVADGLIGEDVQPGQSVALMLPTGIDYFPTFFGVLLAGAVPVPIYPPFRAASLREHLARQAGILDAARAVALVTVPQALPLARLLRARVPSLRAVTTPGDLTPRPCLSRHLFPRFAPTMWRCCSTRPGAPATRRGSFSPTGSCWPTSVPWGLRRSAPRTASSVGSPSTTIWVSSVPGLAASISVSHA